MTTDKSNRHVMAVSIATEQWQEYQEALALLKKHAGDPFKSRSALVVEAVIEAARRLKEPETSATSPG